MKCACGAEFSFGEGRIKGFKTVICPRCQAVEDLAAAHPAAAEAIARGPADGAGALEADAKAEKAVRAFVEKWKGEAEAAALERLALRRRDDAALAALDAAMGWPADRPGRIEALAAVLAESPDPAHLARLAAIAPERAAAALGSITVPADLPPAWEAPLRALLAAGRGGPVAEALGRAGVRPAGRALALARDAAAAGAGDAVVAWLGAARFVGEPAEIAAFVRALPAETGRKALEALLDRADDARAVDLLAALRDRDGLRARVEAMTDPSAEAIHAVKRNVGAIGAEAVVAALRRWAAGGPSPALRDLAGALGDSAEAADLAADWAEAAGRLSEAAGHRRRAATLGPTPERTAAVDGFRAMVLRRLRAAEEAAAPNLRAAVELLLLADIAGARRLLDEIRSTEVGRASVHGLAAAFLGAAVSAVEALIAVEHGGLLSRASQARKVGGGKPLADAGALERSVADRLRRFRTDVAAVLEADAPPFPRLPLPLPSAPPPTRAADREADGASRDRYEALRDPRDSTTSEAEFLKPILRARLLHAVATLGAGGDEPRWGETVDLERDSAYGFLARVAGAPAAQGDETNRNDRIAPREMYEALVLRAVAFVPGAGVYAFDRRSRHRASFMEAYQVLGRDPAEIVAQTETWAAWDPRAPAGAERAAHVPIADPSPAAVWRKTLEEIRRAPRPPV